MCAWDYMCMTQKMGMDRSAVVRMHGMSKFI